MNNEKMRRQILAMGIGTPLVLLSATWTTSFWLASALLIIIATLWTVDLMLPASVRPSLRQIMLLVTAAIESTLLDLLLQAHAWPQHVALQAYWPIVAIAGFGFFCMQKGTQQHAEVNQHWPARSFIVAACMIVLASVLTQLLNSTDRIVFVPGALLLVIGGLCALVQRLTSKPDNATNSKIRRVRVTGPVS